MDFKIDKKIKFAVVGKVPIQVGRDTIIEGNVAMATANKYPPIQMLSDFQHFDTALATKIENFETFLKTQSRRLRRSDRHGNNTAEADRGGERGLHGLHTGRLH